MISQPSPIQPPHLAIWLLEQFAPLDQVEAISGDLLEEFSGIAAKSGIVDARRWYWRQTLKTIARLFGDGFRSAQLLAAVLGAGLLGIGGIWLNEKLVAALLYRYQIYLYIHPYLFWVIYAILTGRFLVPMALGFVAAVAAAKRAMVAALTLSLLFGVTGAVQLLPWIRYLNRWNHYTFPHPLVAVILATTFISPVAIFIGGLMGRRTKSVAAHGPQIGAPETED